MNFLNNISFVRKIQLGFLLIAVISTAIVVNDLFSVKVINKSEEQLAIEVTAPKETIERIDEQFLEMQFTLLKFSIIEFEPNFPNLLRIAAKDKAVIDSLIAHLEVFEKSEDLGQTVKNIKSIWGNYKSNVAERIINTVMKKNFGIASVIAGSSGEDAGKQLSYNLNQMLLGLQARSGQITGEIRKKNENSFLLIVIGAILGTSVFITCVFWLAPKITLPIKKLSEELASFAEGDYERKYFINSNDEFGELSSYIEKVRLAQLEKIRQVKNIEEGIFIRTELLSNNDLLGVSLNNVVNSINNIFEETERIIAANSEGDLHFRGRSDIFSGNWKQFIININSTLEVISAPVNEASNILEVIANGDLTRHLSAIYSGDYQRIIDNINKVVTNLGEALTSVTEASSEITVSASQILASAEEMAAGATEQCSQTADIAKAVGEMAKSGSENTRNAKLSSESARVAGQKAKDSGDVIWETINGINKLADFMNQSALSVRELGKNSDQIGEIVEVIDEIADQTNLLALNAAIEAARAGEQGRGFAVVADEVRKLAERTSKATKEISRMIKKIQNDTEQAVEVMQLGTEEVEQGKLLAVKAGGALNEIIDITMENAGRMEQLALANESQSSASNEISRVVEQINNVSHQSANGIQQISKSAENLYRLTGTMQEMLNKFQIGTPNIGSTKKSSIHPT